MQTQAWLTLTVPRASQRASSSDFFWGASVLALVCGRPLKTNNPSGALRREETECVPMSGEGA